MDVIIDLFGDIVETILLHEREHSYFDGCNHWCKVEYCIILLIIMIICVLQHGIEYPVESV